MSQAKYRLSGIETRIVTAISRMGNVHMFFTNCSWFGKSIKASDRSERALPLHFLRVRSRPSASSRRSSRFGSRAGGSEPFWPNECSTQVDEHQGGHCCSQVNHTGLLQIRAQPSANARQAAMLIRPSANRAGSQTMRFMAVIPEARCGFATRRFSLWGVQTCPKSDLAET